MIKTASLKLLASEEDKQALLKIMCQFNKACSWASEYAFEHKIFKQFDLSNKIYYQLREKFDLSAEFAVRVIAKVSKTYKIDKKVCHKFKDKSSVEYYKNNLNIKNIDLISILSINGRLKKIRTEYAEYLNLKEQN